MKQFLFVMLFAVTTFQAQAQNIYPIDSSEPKCFLGNANEALKELVSGDYDPVFSAEESTATADTITGVQIDENGTANETVLTRCQIKDVSSCVFDYNDNNYLVSITEVMGTYYGAVEEIWGEGEEYELAEFDVSFDGTGKFTQIPGANSTVAGFEYSISKNKEVSVKMDTAASGEQNVKFNGFCKIGI